MKNEEKINLLFAEDRGIYIPFDFYLYCDFEEWNLDKEDYPELCDPAITTYDDAFEEVVEKAFRKDDQGFSWRLHWIEGELLEIRDDYDWPEE